MFSCMCSGDILGPVLSHSVHVLMLMVQSQQTGEDFLADDVSDAGRGMLGLDLMSTTLSPWAVMV